MPDGLYQGDALAWAEHQAGLLRRLAAVEKVNAAVDWPNVIEEVQDVGLSELRACQSLIEQALTNLLKLHALPDSPAIAHRRDDVRAFLNDAERRFTPSMAQRIGLEKIYGRALSRARAAVEDAGGMGAGFPVECPFMLAELIGEAPDVNRLTAMVSASRRF